MQMWQNNGMRVIISVDCEISRLLSGEMLSTLFLFCSQISFDRGRGLNSCAAGYGAFLCVCGADVDAAFVSAGTTICCAIDVLPFLAFILH
jgi:hypothetical protein